VRRVGRFLRLAWTRASGHGEGCISAAAGADPRAHRGAEAGCGGSFRWMMGEGCLPRGERLTRARDPRDARERCSLPSADDLDEPGERRAIPLRTCRDGVGCSARSTRRPHVAASCGMCPRSGGSAMSDAARHAGLPRGGVVARASAAERKPR
jgi:hypothetical protein